MRLTVDPVTLGVSTIITPEERTVRPRHEQRRGDTLTEAGDALITPPNYGRILLDHQHILN